MKNVEKYVIQKIWNNHYKSKMHKFDGNHKNGLQIQKIDQKS